MKGDTFLLAEVLQNSHRLNIANNSDRYEATIYLTAAPLAGDILVAADKPQP
jgi:hypothetical protein